MKSVKRVIEEHPEYARLIRSIVHVVGKDHFEDIMNHGADCGFPGITYLSDCVDLAWKNRKQIINLLEELSDETGEDIGNMLRSWRCIGKDYRSNELVKSLYRSTASNLINAVDATLWNGLAWFAAEEVSRWFCDE